MLHYHEIPDLVDSSGALANRFILLRLKNSFLHKEDVGLEKKLLQELSRIFNWALDGLDRLRERGHFIQPAASADMFEGMREMASPVGTFVRDWCELDPEYTIECSSLFRAWQEWHGEQGRRARDAAVFGRDLFAAAPQLSKTRRRTSGTRSWHYEGIKLRPEYEHRMLDFTTDPRLPQEAA